MASSNFTLHDMMVQLRGVHPLLGYNMHILTAALRLKPEQWMPLRDMTEEEFHDLEENLTRMNHYPHIYEARLVDGVSEVRSRVILRRTITVGPAEAIQPWEVDVSLLKDHPPE